ncbi:MRN complex-interacting protein [Diprion similis]|uniref:MRN complex-interacting protein n=1 Tax=Diprion similis TaxID=362088 RepID=UPI001EF7E2DA|nr:MRN complex-interacting protein [Diprion similis]
MGQELNVLQCFSCKMFQVHIVKKAKKWQCKICNEMQSIQHVYYQGSGQDCRLQVQHLNLMKNTANQRKSDVSDVSSEMEVKENVITERPTPHSKWTKYLVETEEKPCEKDLTSDNETLVDKDIDDKEQAVSLLFDNNKIKTSISTRSQDRNTNISMLRNRTEDKQNEELLEGSHALSTNTYTRNGANINIELPDNSNPQSLIGQGASCSLNYFGLNETSTTPQSYAKRKFCTESVIYEYESRNENRIELNSYSPKPAGTMFKRSKMAVDVSFRKRNLENIVKPSSSKCEETFEKSDKNNLTIKNDKLLLKERNCSLSANQLQVHDFSLKKKSFFETDSDDFDDILDF